MTSHIEMPLSSEALAVEEITQITGCQRKSDQANWFKKNGWTFYRNKGGDPIVGRLYARLKLAGVNPAEFGAPSRWKPDFSKL